MDLAIFEDLLDRHGGDPGRWPASQREAALAFVAASPQARAAFAATVEVEGVLRRVPCVEAAAGIDAIVARATRHRQETRTYRVASRAGWAAAAAAVLALGLFVGDLIPSPDTTSPDRIVATALDASGFADVE